jgi:hypothetical protein
MPTRLNPPQYVQITLLLIVLGLEKALHSVDLLPPYRHHHLQTTQAHCQKGLDHLVCENHRAIP